MVKVLIILFAIVATAFAYGRHEGYGGPGGFGFPGAYGGPEGPGSPAGFSDPGAFGDHQHRHLSTFPKNRIHGKTIDIEEAPYQVSLEQRNSLLCGGTLIHPQIVVTAAHCVMDVKDPYNVPGEELLVRAGSNQALRGGYIYFVRRIEIHPKFTSSDFGDIALIYLSTAVNISNRVKPIPLAKETPSFAQTAHVTGYDLRRIPAPFGNYLMATDLSVYGKWSCGASGHMMDDQICAGTVDHRDTCRGDSGDPVVVNNQLAGITIFDKGCKRIGPYGDIECINCISTDIAYHKDWIDQCSKRLLKQSSCGEELLIRLPRQKSRRSRRSGSPRNAEVGGRTQESANAVKRQDKTQ